MFFRSSFGPAYLGIDIGASGIKIVECLNEKGVPRLANYAFSQEPLETIGKKDPRDNPEECAAVLREIITRAHITSSKAIASLPTFSVFSSVITVGEEKRTVLEEEIKEKAKKIIPLPMEEMVLDWKIVSETLEQSTDSPSSLDVIAEKPQRIRRVLITAAQRKLVSSYIQIFKLAKLELLSLETESFALIRSLMGNDASPAMMVDMGAATTNLSIIQDLTPVLDRSLDTGGINLTKRLSEVLSVNMAHAEEIKKDLGLSLQNTQSPALAALKEMLNPILHEIRYTANLYGGNLSKLILTGGSAFLPLLPSYLQETFNTRVIIGDPWNPMIFPKGLEGVLSEIGPRFSVAAGLAMREIL